MLGPGKGLGLGWSIIISIEAYMHISLPGLSLRLGFRIWARVMITVRIRVIVRIRVTVRVRAWITIRARGVMG